MFDPSDTMRGIVATAKAGTQGWVPAFAGMTEGSEFRVGCNAPA